MKTLSKLIYLIFDFFLPRSKEIQFLESRGPAEIREAIPPAERMYRDEFYALFSYQNDLARALVWEIKYRRNKKLVRLVATLLYDLILEEISDMELFSGSLPPLLIPTPLHKERQRKRGFNQAELIAREITKQDGGENFVFDINVIEKVFQTVPQTSLSREQRLKNLKDAFKVTSPEKVRGRNIILIDDVTTTGATIAEIRKILLKAGAREVKAFTIAH